MEILTGSSTWTTSAMRWRWTVTALAWRWARPGTTTMETLMRDMCACSGIMRACGRSWVALSRDLLRMTLWAGPCRCRVTGAEWRWARRSGARPKAKCECMITTRERLHGIWLGQSLSAYLTMTTQAVLCRCLRMEVEWLWGSHDGTVSEG